LVISIVGGALGFLFVVAARGVLAGTGVLVVPLFADLRVDRSVLLFDIGLSLVAPILFGVLPALASSKAGAVNDRATAGSRESTWLRGLLVAGEVALSIVLVVGAVLLVRSLVRLQQVDPGFNPDQVVTFTLTLPTSRYANPADRLRGLEAIEQRIRETPGVQAVGATSTLALRGYTWSGDSTIEGRASTDF